MIHAGVGDDFHRGPNEVLGHHSLVLRVQRHALHHDRIRAIPRRSAHKGNLLADVHRALFSIFLLRAVGQNPRGLSARGLGPGAQPRLAQRRGHQPRDAGLAARAVHHHADGNGAEGAPMQRLFSDPRRQERARRGDDQGICQILHKQLCEGVSGDECPRKPGSELFSCPQPNGSVTEPLPRSPRASSPRCP